MSKDRQDNSRNGNGSRRPGWLRLGWALLAVVVLAAGFAFFPSRIRAGVRLTDLRMVIGASAEQANTGAARKTQARYCVDRAETILRDLPDNERALYYRARYRQVLAECISRDLAGQTVVPEQRAEVERRVYASRDAARELCRKLPVAGYYQALYARELNFSAWYDKSVAIPDVIRAFETAHTNYPNVPQVTWLCLQAFAEILEVDRDVLSATELARVEGLFAAMGTALLEQQPDRSAEVLKELQRPFPEPDRLIAVTPPRLLCLDPLYEMFFRQGRYEHCAELIEIMERVNRERVTRQDREKIGLYELSRTHPRSREEMTADLARRRLTLASARGAGTHYAALRQAEIEARQALADDLLEAAIEAAAAGDYYRALRQGRSVATRFPEVAETYPCLAGWLLTVGEGRRAAEQLEVLLGMPRLPPEAIEHGIEVADKLEADRSARDTGALVADVLRVRRAEVGSPLDKEELDGLRQRLTAWAEGGGRTASVARFGHMALFSAGRAAELAGDPRGAAALYRQALELCPLHRPSVDRLLALPPDAAGEAQSVLRTQLDDAGLQGVDRQRELVVAAPGVTLRHLAVTPSVIDPTQAVRVNAVVEITGEVDVPPALPLAFGCADGTAFSSRIAGKDWRNAPEKPRLGQLLVAEIEIVPAIASIEAGHGLPDGPVILRIRGAGRDAGFTFHHPAFEVRRKAAQPAE
ncbi:MAG: hypothetical protein JXR77_15455 [Lentisphaeria bacterium]|nr:hypothetical protein [Lentisphaeria bacterium]